MFQDVHMFRYFPALKTLEQLEHTYLPRVERYKIAKEIAKNIIIFRKQIKDASFSDFTDFLENIRNVIAKIGQIALKQVIPTCGCLEKSVLSKIHIISIGFRPTNFTAQRNQNL